MQNTLKTQELPADNGPRLAIYDAINEYVRETGKPGISYAELFDRVIGRLRVLVPRELHFVGDQEYFNQKVNACLDAGIIATRSDNGRDLLTLTGQPPQVLYPD